MMTDKPTLHPKVKAAAETAIADRLELSGVLLAVATAQKEVDAEIAAQWSLPGPGGVDITSGVPTGIYVAIGRNSYESEYEVAREVACAAREEISASILKGA